MLSGTPRVHLPQRGWSAHLLYIHQQSQRSLSSAGVRPKRPPPPAPKGLPAAQPAAAAAASASGAVGSGLLVDNGTLTVLQLLPWPVARTIRPR
jgi:hypothetical protein